MTNAYLLETADRVTKAKAVLDLAERGVQYYERVLAAAKERRGEKYDAMLLALADLKALGGEV